MPCLSSNSTVCVGSLGSSPSLRVGVSSWDTSVETATDVSVVATCVELVAGSTTVVEVSGMVVAEEIVRDLEAIFDAPGPPETLPAPSSTESVVGSGNVVSLVGTVVSVVGTLVSGFSFSTPDCRTGLNKSSPVRPMMSSACC